MELITFIGEDAEAAGGGTDGKAGDQWRICVQAVGSADPTAFEPNLLIHVYIHVKNMKNHVYDEHNYVPNPTGLLGWLRRCAPHVLQ